MLTTVYLFGYYISVFPIVFIAGLLVGNFFFSRYIRKSVEIREWKMIALQVMLIATFFVGGFIGHIIMYVLARPYELGGFTIMGSILLMALTIPLMARVTRIGLSGKQLADIVAVSFVPTQVIGKLGCLAVGCCYGTKWDGFCSITFPEGSAAPLHTHLHPVQIYEALGLLLLWFVCLRVYRRGVAPGVVMGVFLIGKGVERFLAEFVRGDVVLMGSGLTTGQMAAIACMLIGGAYILFRTRDAAKMRGVSKLSVPTGSAEAVVAE